jgi:hypothetical protein
MMHGEANVVRGHQKFLEAVRPRLLFNGGIGAEIDPLDQSEY